MELTIKGTDYTIKFGTKFVRVMDEKFTMNRDGMTFGAGLESTVGFLFSKKITTLADYIYYGTVTEKKRPSLNDVEDFLDDAEDIEAIFDEVIAELESSNASKLFMTQVKDNLNQED